MNYKQFKTNPCMALGIPPFNILKSNIIFDVHKKNFMEYKVKRTLFTKTPTSYLPLHTLKVCARNNQQKDNDGTSQPIC